MDVRPPRPTLFPYTTLFRSFRVAKKVEQIIREEQDRIGAQEMEMPVLTPAEVWKVTGRWDVLEPVTFRTKDHNGRELDRKSTRLNSSHANISYAVFCLKKKQ